MRRKTLLLSAGLALLLLSGLAAILYLIVRHEPSFYQRSEVLPGPARKDLSTAFVNRFVNLISLATDGRNDWEVPFSEAMINSYFEEDYIRHGVDKPFRAKGITAPRITIEADRIRLGFRYGSDPWSTIVSVDFRLWLPTKSQDVNVVCLEILGRKAGALPVSAQSLLELISEQARKDIEVTWYRHDGNPVALLRFQNDRPRPTFQLRRLELRNGMLTIGGLSPDPRKQGLAPADAITSGPN